MGKSIVEGEDEDFLSHVAAAEAEALSAKRRKISITTPAVEKAAAKGVYTAALRGSTSPLFQQQSSSSSSNSGLQVVAAGNNQNVFASPELGGGGGSPAAGGRGSCFKCGKSRHWAHDCGDSISNSNSNSNSYGIDHSVPEKACPCILGTCLVDTANTDTNRGRKFYKCHVREVDGSTLGSHVRPSTSIDYTEAFTTEMVFGTQDELIEWTRLTGKANGLVIVIKSSHASGRNQRAWMRFACERGGKCRKYVKKSEKEVKRRPNSTGSKKCGCPFELKCFRELDGWTVNVFNGTHNHPNAIHLAGHSTGRLSSDETSLVEWSKSLVKPRDILSALQQQDSNYVTTTKSIYNARHKHQVDMLAGRSQMQQLLTRLAEHNYVEWHRTNDDTGCVTDLFWSHPIAGNLLRAFPRVLIMGCTYKTNRYKFPLLEIVGVTSTEMTFSAAFAFVEFEKEDNYTWVLEKLKGMMLPNLHPNVVVCDRELALMNAIACTFPHAKNHLCRSHINKNILAKCKEMFDDKTREEFNHSWHLLVLSPTVTVYNDRLRALERDFNMYPAMLNYVKSSWLNDYKEKFVGVWTDTSLHFGNLTSSRVKSSHSKLKRHLQSSQGTFYGDWEKMHTLVEKQWTEIRTSFRKSLNRVQHSCNGSLFSGLRGFVSKNAMEYVLAESRRVQYIVKDNIACECVIRQTHGIPCAHEIAPLMAFNCGVPLSSIHNHWKKLDVLTPPKDPSLTTLFKADFEILFNQFENMDAADKIDVMNKMKELVHPCYTPMVEPQTKAKENWWCGYFEWCDEGEGTNKLALTSQSSASNPGIPDLSCPCGAGSCLTAITGKNIGHAFYRCPANQGSSCGFSKWCHDQTVANSPSNETIKKCFRCGKDGHWAKDCNLPSMQNPADRGGRSA